MRRLRVCIVALVAAPLLLYATEAPQSVTISAGTKIIVRATKPVTPRKVKSGQKLRFVVHEDVLVENRVVIRADAPVEVIVTDAQSASSWASRQGRLDFTIEAVEAVDGTRIEVRNYKDYAQLGATPSFGHAYYSNPKIAKDQTFLGAVKKDTVVQITAATEDK